jgi:hypothetical protein
LTVRLLISPGMLSRMSSRRAKIGSVFYVRNSFFLANHSALAGQAKDRHLVVEIAGAAVPSVMDFAMARKRGVKSGYARCSALFEPFDQGVARPDSQPAEVEDLQPGPTPGMQSRDPLQGLQIIIKGRTDKNPDLQIGPAARSRPVVETMHELLKAGERERAALA